MIGSISIGVAIVGGLASLIIAIRWWLQDAKKKRKREVEKEEYTKKFLAEKGYNSMEEYLNEEGKRLIEEARKEREIEEGLNKLAQAGKLRINGQLVERISNGTAVIKREEQDNDQQ